MLNNVAIYIRFDQKPETTLRLQSAGNIERINLVGPLILGGIYPNHTAHWSASPSRHIPPYFYSGMLHHGYVGCMQDVEINGQSVNLTYHVTRDRISGIMTSSGNGGSGSATALAAAGDATAAAAVAAAPVCSPMPNQCDLGHCLNDGVCVEGWNRFVCDCSATGFNGPICNQRKFDRAFSFFHFQNDSIDLLDVFQYNKPF